MTDGDKKIRAYLCPDHFERICNNRACNTCPSLAENKEAIEALAKMYEDEPEGINRAVLTEIQSLRRVQQSASKTLTSLREAIHGNGKQGIAARVLVLETKLNQTTQSNGTWMVVIGLIISSLIGCASLVVALFKG